MMTSGTMARYDGAVSPMRKGDLRVAKGFGRALKIARVRADLTREELRQAAGLKRADEVGRFERGEREPTLSVFVALARGLGVTTQSLLAETESHLRDIRPAPAAAKLAPEPEAKAPAVAPVALAIIVRDGRTLMTKRVTKENGAFRWGFPSGQVEADSETPEEAVVREAREELGVSIAVDHWIGERTPELTGRHLIYFACRLVTGEPELIDHEELAELHWLTLDDVDRVAAPQGGIFEPVREYLMAAMAGERA